MNKNEMLTGMKDFPNELHLLMNFHMQMGRWPKEPWELTSFEECEGLPLVVTNYPIRFSGNPFSDKWKVQLLRVDENFEKAVPFGELEFGVLVEKDEWHFEDAKFGPSKRYSCVYHECNGGNL